MNEQRRKNEPLKSLMDTEELVESLNKAYSDFLNGERGRPAGETMDELCRELGLPEATEEDVAAVEEALRDFDNGDRGRPAGEHSAQLRKERNYLRD